jgi:hypothetical protein
VTAASEPDILAGVERWARVRGLTLSQDPIKHGLSWGVAPRAVHGVTVWCWADDSGEHRLSPALALAWALTVETDAAPVDVGRCPACMGKRGWSEWLFEQHELGPHPYSGMGFSDRVHELNVAGWETWKAVVKAPLRNFEGRRIATIPAARPCPACSGTGRESIPAARLLLDAATGDTRALEHLPKHADRLQLAGDPLGELLGLAMGPWAGEPVDCGPCDDERCENGLTDSGGVTQWDTPAMVRCPSCSGSGRLLGHPHTAAALAWLERLTDARQEASTCSHCHGTGTVRIGTADYVGCAVCGGLAHRT